MARRLIGTGTTNAQGIATCNTTYTGVGAGKLQIIAVSGNLQSETYELWDYIRYDLGTTNEHKDIWSDMECFTRNTTDSRFYYDNTNGESNKAVTFGSAITLIGENGLEIETTSLGTSTARLQIARYETGKTTTYNNCVLQNIGKYKIEIKNGVTNWYLGTTLFKTDTSQPNESYSVAIITNTGTESDFNFKNVVIYPI